MQWYSRIGVFVMCGLVWGCTQKVTFPVSPVVPAAKAEAKIKQDDNGNARVQLSVRHLARPERLHPPQKFYVVWVQRPDGRIVNLGKMNLNDDLEGEFLGVTPWDNFRILITGESTPDGSAPVGTAVLATESFSVK